MQTTTQAATEATAARPTTGLRSPEPWTANDNGCVVDAGGALVVSVPRPKGAGAAARRDANKALIAAAPDLLAACERMAQLIDALMPSVPWGSTWNTGDWMALLNEAPGEARAAIAKAKGGAQ